MRDEPTYSEALERSVVGDDPLGLAPTNERLYNSAFPGFNNYVRYIRVYSAICWMTQQLTRALEQGDETTLDADKVFAVGMEKIELALLWANLGAQQLAGTRRRRHFPEDDEPIELSFATFGPSEVTLIAAVTYRPSLTGGFQLLEAKSGKTYECLPHGEALADAYDRAVCSLDDYEWLKSTSETECTRSRIEGLLPALNFEKPSRDERLAFLATFFPERLGDDTRPDDVARWRTLHLMLNAVSAAAAVKSVEGNPAGATIEQVRACMARGVSEDGTAIVDEELEQVQAWWSVLQVRQLQRLCLEANYCVVERWISMRESDSQGQSIDQCIREVAQSSQAFLDERAALSVNSLRDYYLELQGGRKSLYETAALGFDDEHGYADVFEHIRYLRRREELEFDEDGDCEAVARAYEGLVFCAVEARNLAKNPDALQTMRADLDACSLLRLAEFAERHGTASSEEFIGSIVKEWVLLRHFEVVATRSMQADGKNRFRFVVGDYGLERFDRSAPLPMPAFAADKLEHALALCKQAGLLSGEGRYELTASGRRQMNART